MAHDPSAQLLDPLLAGLAQTELPLHVQVRRGLADLIERHFEDGQRFWTEALLIERLNVSQITVRRALADLTQAGLLERRVAKGTFVRKPAPAPVGLTTVGVFVPQYNSAFLNEFLEHLAGVCWSRPLRLRVYHTQKGEKTADALRQLELPPAQERVILLGQTPQAASALTVALTGRGYRSLIVDTLLSDDSIPYVGTDNRAGVRLGLEHLLGLGHRRILLLVNEPEEAGTVRTRIAEFEAFTAEHGLTECRAARCGVRFWEDSFEIASRAMPALWGEAPAPTAVFATSDPGAWAALKWFSEQGIRVPDQVSVLGFDDEAPSRFTHPALSTVAHPVADLARQAVAGLESDAPVRLFLPPRLIVRRSTGFAPGPDSVPAVPVSERPDSEGRDDDVSK